MKPAVKDLSVALRNALPSATQALSTQTMKLDERTGAISQWRDLTTPALVTLLLDRIDQLERLWTSPSEPMVTAGLGELQRALEQWKEENWELDVNDIDQLNDNDASDMAVFTLQAMASKLPKEPD